MTAAQPAGRGSPGYLPAPKANLSAKGIDTTNTSYDTSHERTRVSDLPFPHPKYHVRPSTGEIYETISPIIEEYDPITGYVDSVEPIMESVEVEVEQGEVERGNRGTFMREDWMQGGNGWTGRVEYPESNERSSIQREAKRDREGGVSEGEGGEGGEGARKKKIREKH